MKPNNLQPHPEGGSFQEVYRSADTIRTETGKSRSALTHIYFSLKKHENSSFHKVTSDEVWNLYRGKGLYLYLWDGTEKSPERVEISAENNCFCYVVPAGMWQATEPIDSEILVGCSVGPGFEFEDFTMLKDDEATAEALKKYHPELQHLV